VIRLVAQLVEVDRFKGGSERGYRHRIHHSLSHSSLVQLQEIGDGLKVAISVGAHVMPNEIASM
jgi:hypothetical protein